MVCNTKLTLAVFTTSAIEDDDVMPGLINLVQALQPDLSMKKQDGQVKNFDKVITFVTTLIEALPLTLAGTPGRHPC